MNGTFYIGATGLEAQQRALEIAANNIANMNTTAFKRSAVRFAELVAPLAEPADPSTTRPAPDQISGLGGVASMASSVIWTQGALRPTGSLSDVAIQGNGFIEVLGSDGQVKLWRGGTLKVNDDGYLATLDGSALRNMISIPAGATTLTIATDGTVTAATAGSDTPTRLGQIELAIVNDPSQLQPLGAGYFGNPSASLITGTQAGQQGAGTIVQGSLEGSNVELADQMVELMLLQRSYAASAQLVQAGDQMMSILNNLRK